MLPVSLTKILLHTSYIAPTTTVRANTRLPEQFPAALGPEAQKLLKKWPLEAKKARFFVFTAKNGGQNVKSDQNQGSFRHTDTLD